MSKVEKRMYRVQQVIPFDPSWVDENHWMLGIALGQPLNHPEIRASTSHLIGTFSVPRCFHGTRPDDETLLRFEIEAGTRQGHSPYTAFIPTKIRHETNHGRVLTITGSGVQVHKGTLHDSGDLDEVYNFTRSGQGRSLKRIGRLQMVWTYPAKEPLPVNNGLYFHAIGRVAEKAWKRVTGERKLPDLADSIYSADAVDPTFLWHFAPPDALMAQKFNEFQDTCLAWPKAAADSESAGDLVSFIASVAYWLSVHTRMVGAAFYEKFPWEEEGFLVKTDHANIVDGFVTPM